MPSGNDLLPGMQLDSIQTARISPDEGANNRFPNHSIFVLWLAAPFIGMTLCGWFDPALDCGHLQPCV